MAKNRDRGRTRSFFAVSFQTNKYRIPIDLRLAKERGLGSDSEWNSISTARDLGSWVNVVDVYWINKYKFLLKCEFCGELSANAVELEPVARFAPWKELNWQKYCIAVLYSKLLP